MLREQHCNTLLITMLALLIPLGTEARQRVNMNDVELEVITTYGQPFEQYPLYRNRGQEVYRAYLEAKAGARYAIQVRNRSARRLGLLIAVDGRNVISGTKSYLQPTEQMYILEPHQRAVYSGWRTGKNRVNDFFFTETDNSYAGAWGDYTAMGVIAVAAYREAHYHSIPKDAMHPNNRFHNEDPTPRARSAPESTAEAGTGFGSEQWSPSRRVHFEPKPRPFAKYFLKYEWREILCDKGIIDCYWPKRPGNRFWEEQNRFGIYAPHPPNNWKR